MAQGIVGGVASAAAIFQNKKQKLLLWDLASLQDPGRPVGHLGSQDHQEPRIPCARQRPQKRPQRNPPQRNPGKEEVASAMTGVPVYNPAGDLKVALTVPLPLWVYLRTGGTCPEGPSNPRRCPAGHILMEVCSGLTEGLA